MTWLLILINKTIPVVEAIPFKETVWYDLLLALITGIISSVIFFGILRVFKPRIKTCNIISKSPYKDDDGNIKYNYHFKFINKTFADIENVSLELMLMEDYFNGTSKNFTSKNLTLVRPEFKFLKGKWNKDKEIHNNCVQMRVVEDLEEIWNGDREWLQLQIDSTHSKSGRRSVHVQVFKDPKNTIKIGKFNSGENFDLIKH